MKSTHAVLAVLAAIALAQAAQAATAPDHGDSIVTSLVPTATGLVSKVECYLSVVGRLLAFVADIPRNCLDLAWRSQSQFLYVLPACVVYSGAATYQLGTILFPTCASA